MKCVTLCFHGDRLRARSASVGPKSLCSLVLLGFATMASAQPAVLSYAVGETVTNAFESTTPGEIVRSSISKSTDVLSFFGGEVVSTISVTSSAQAQTDFGVNRIYASGATITSRGVDSRGFGVSGNLFAGTYASSQWRDVWRMNGELGTYSPVTVAGRLTGSIGMSAQDLALRFANGDPIALGVYYSADFGLVSSTGGSAPRLNFTGRDFVDALGVDGTFSIPWSVSGLAPRGYSMDVQSLFEADARGGNLACRTLADSSCSSFVTFASLSTAKIDRIIVADGDILTADSGALVNRNGYITYAAAIPEPSIYGMMGLGLTLILAVTARRQKKGFNAELHGT